MVGGQHEQWYEIGAGKPQWIDTHYTDVYE